MNIKIKESGLFFEYPLIECPLIEYPLIEYPLIEYPLNKYTFNGLIQRTPSFANQRNMGDENGTKNERNERWQQLISQANEYLEKYAMKQGWKEVPEIFYEKGIRPKLLRILQKARSQKATHTTVLFRKLLGPYQVYNNDRIEDLYLDMEDLFWNEYGIDITFGGINGGSGVTLYYTQEPDAARIYFENDGRFSQTYIQERLQEIEKTAASVFKSLQLSLVPEKNGMHVCFDGIGMNAGCWSFMEGGRLVTQVDLFCK